MTSRIRSYGVIGRRADVWPVAAMLARHLPREIAVSVSIEKGDVSQTAVVPLSDRYFAALDFGPGDLARGGADFALGYALEGFARDGKRIIVAPSGDLPAIGGLAFHHILRRVAREAQALDRFVELYQGFRFAARGAEKPVMAMPDDAPDSPLAMLGPLAVITREKLADLVEATISPGRVGLQGAWDADLVIDLRPDQRDQGPPDRQNLPLLPIEFDYRTGGLPSYRRGGRITEARFLIPRPWQGNRVMLGPASGSLGALFAADTRLLLMQITSLANCLPYDSEMSAEARRFNRSHRRCAARLEEFLVAPFVLGGTGPEDIEPPENLVLRIEQFRNRGRIPEFDGDILDRQFWIDLMLSFGVVPRHHDRRAEAFDPRQLDRALGTIRGQLDGALASMPSYDGFMRRLSDR